ncbi:MAG: hypothetical protein WAN11_00280 [Syntrophobacteraceae bacterium]
MRFFEEHGLKSRKEIIFVLAMAAIIIFIRKPDAFTNPQFFAEDGKIVFLQQFKQGFTAIFNVYAGYLLLVSRIVGLLSDLFFPYSAAPYVYNYSCFIITMLVIANIYSRRFDYEPKWLLALSIVMVPHFGYEVGVCNVNLQWVLCILLVTNYLKEQPSERYGNVTFQVTSDVIQMVLVGLTGPFIIFMLPLYLWRFLKEKNRYRSVILCTAIAVSSVQAACILTSKDAFPSAAAGAEAGWVYSLDVIGVKLFGNLFLPGKLTEKIYGWNHYILFCLFVSVIGLIFYKAVRSMKNVHAVTVLVGLSLFILISTLFKSRYIMTAFIDPWGGAGPRYFYPQYVLITWALLLCLGKGKMWTDYAIKILLAAICIASLSSYRAPSMVD